jgi:hypothetical protein
MPRLHITSLPLLALALAACHQPSPKPCGGVPGTEANGRWKELVPTLPAGAVVCESDSAYIRIDVPGGDVKDLVDRSLATLQAKGFALDPDDTAQVRASGFDVGLRRDVLGVHVAAGDSGPAGGGLRQLELSVYAACPPAKAYDDVSQWLIEGLVDAMLAGPSNDLYCEAVRAVLPDANALPEKMRSSPAYAAEYAAFTLEPTALFDALAAARATHGKAAVRRPSSFADPLYDGVRGRLGALVEAPPLVVTVGGMVVGYVTTSGGPDSDYLWIAPLEVVHVDEPPARARPAKAKSSARRMPNVYVVHSE